MTDATEAPERKVLTVKHVGPTEYVRADLHAAALARAEKAEAQRDRAIALAEEAADKYAALAKAQEKED